MRFPNMSRSNTSQSRLYTVNAQKRFLAPSSEPKILHSFPTALVETNQCFSNTSRLSR